MEDLIDKTRIKVWAGDSGPHRDTKTVSYVWSESKTKPATGPVRTVSPYFQARLREGRQAAAAAYQWYRYYGDNRTLYLWNNANREGTWEVIV